MTACPEQQQEQQGMTGGGFVRTQMLRAALLMLLFALGTILYQTVHQTDDNRFVRGGTWLVSVAAFQTAVLSSELTAPRQERPATTVIYDASNDRNDSVLRQDEIADSGLHHDNLSAVLKAGDIDVELPILKTSTGDEAESGLESPSVIESDPQPERVVVSATAGDKIETESDLGVGKDDIRNDAAEKNGTDSTVLTLAQMIVTDQSVGRGNVAPAQQALEVVVSADSRLENATENVTASPDEQSRAVAKEAVKYNISGEQQEEATSGAENVSLQDVGGGGVAVPPVPAVANLTSSLQELLWRSQAEDQLRMANLAIQDPSYVLQYPVDLHAPVYLNVTRFKRSYELMHKVFKIFAYKEGLSPLVHAGPRTGIYSSEGQFIQRINKGSRYVTDDPQKAHMFFLPYSVVNMVAKLYVPGSHTMLPLATFIKDYVYDLAEKYPFWNMTQGADHFFVACHDWGPATARDHPTLRSNAVKAVCNADLTEEFVLEKDVSLPEVYIHKPKKGTKVYDMSLGGNEPAGRPYLSFFAGQMHGRVRPVLLQHWKDKDPDMKIYEVLPRAVSKKISYMSHMKRSKFCICAAGYEVNSPRVVESIYYECVPVIIADNFVLPFSDVLDWSAFSITVPEKDIPNLKQILLGVSDERYREMQGRLRYVKQHFLWHPRSPEQYDAFHMIMHSVWLRRLRQVHS